MQAKTKKWQGWQPMWHHKAVSLAGPGRTQHQCLWSIISDFCLLPLPKDTAKGFSVFQKFVLPDFINSDISWQVSFQHFSSLGVLLGVPMGEGSRLIFCQPLAYKEKTSETSICQSKEVTWSCTQNTWESQRLDVLRQKATTATIKSTPPWCELVLMTTII